MNFEWSTACEAAFMRLKQYLTLSPLLSKPLPSEHLFIYLSVSPNSLSAVLVREDDDKQHSVYYVSISMLNSEKRYPQLEKLAFTLGYGFKEA